MRELLADGYPAAQLATQMLETILVEGGGISSKQKAFIATQLAETDKQLIDGADEYLQLTNLLAFTMRQMRTAA